MIPSRASCLCVAAWLLAWPSLLPAAPGDLDPTFGTGGKVTTALGTSSDEGYGVAVQDDGKIVVAGYAENGPYFSFAVARYETNGSLDTSFGRGGKVVTRVGSDMAVANCVVVQPDGKIVVAGYSDTGSNQDFAVVRYTATGALDPTFNGTGIVITPVGSGNDQALGIALQSDGKIVVTGFASTNADFEFATVRYTSSGALDPTFSDDGVVLTSFGIGTDLAYSVLVQPDGKIVVGGTANIASQFQFAVVRYTDMGILDTSFSGDGIANLFLTGVTNTGRSLALQSDGKIVLAGFAQTGVNQDLALVRFEADGDVDFPFNGGQGGIVVSTNAGDDFAVSVAVQSDGKIVVAGNSSVGASNTDLLVARFTSAGVLDTTFHGDGFVTTSFGSFTDVGNAVAVQNDGRIVVAGSAQNGSNSDFALARYEAFAAGDVDSLDANIVGNHISTIAVQPDGKILIGGNFSTVGGLTRINLARLHPDGSVDAGFTANTDDDVFGIAVQPDGKILIAGRFSTVNGGTSNFIARLNADGSLENTSTFDPGTGPDGTVVGVILQNDGKILIRGAFNSVDSVNRRFIARLNADGSVDTDFVPPAPSIIVSGMALQTDGKILYGSSSPALERLNEDGSVDASFTPPGGISEVREVVVQPDGKILAGCALAPYLTRFETNGALDASFDASAAANGEVTSLALQADGKILATGSFGASQRIVRLDGAGNLEPSFGTGTGTVGRVEGLAVQADGKVLVGGQFISFNNVARVRLARLSNDAVTRTLQVPDTARAEWQRDGTAPDLTQVTFAFSMDNGANWTPLGPGTRIGTSPDWQITGLSLPFDGLLRAQGRTVGSDSSGLVEQITPFHFDTVIVTVNSGGTAVVAPDLPGDTKILDFTAPDIGVSGGRILTDDGRKLDAVFNEQGVVLLHGRQTVAIDPGGGVDMGVIAKLQPPTGDAVLATLVPGGGVAKANDQVLFTGLLSDNPQPTAREGQDVPESPDTALQSFVTVDGNGSATFFLARLRAKSPAGKSGVGLFAVGPGPTGARLLVQTGQAIGAKRVKVIATLVGQAGSLAEGRWRGGPNRLGVRLTFKEDNSQALYSIPATANDPDDWLPIAQKGDDAMPDLTGAKLASFQLPAYAPDAAIFDALLQKGTAGITRKNSRAVFDAQGVETDGPITLKLLAQVAGPAPAQSNFQLFLNILAGRGRASTLIRNATLDGSLASRGTIFDARQDGVLRPIARLGEDAPGGGKFDRFVSVAKPDGQGYGALVSALLKTSKPDGITAKNRAALYAVDSKGDLRRILRAGDQIESAGPGSALKPVKTFVALTAAPGSIGAARGYDNNGRVNALVTFTDRTQAVVSIQVP